MDRADGILGSAKARKALFSSLPLMKKAAAALTTADGLAPHVAQGVASTIAEAVRKARQEVMV